MQPADLPAPLFTPLAVANGVLRDLLLTPVLGDTPGRAARSVALSVLIFCLTLLFIKRLGVGTRRECLLVCGSWPVLTLLFELTFFVLVWAIP